MDNICSSCHQLILDTYYYCPNCGKNIRLSPLQTNFSTQLTLYFKALLLPPMGLIWGYRYLRQSDRNSQLVGWAVIILTVVELFWIIQSTVYTVNTVNQQIFQQMRNYGL